VISVFKKKLTITIGSVVPNNTQYTNSDLADLLSVELDKGITNYLISRNIHEFKKSVYLSRARVLMWNLIPNKTVNNPKLLARLLSHEITVQELCETMTHREMYPDRYIQVDQELLDEFNHKYGTIDPDTLPDGALKCVRCKSMKTSYYETMLRSCDEPATIFAKCHKCGKNWRIG
jgi:DNA-directed RNA polymerase subunit M/transcription elongation factor TFIIS